MSGFEIVEVLGLAALLAATLWQLYTISIVSEMAYQVRLKRVDEKLDLLWEYLAKHIATQFDKSVVAVGPPEYVDAFDKWLKAGEQSIEKHPLMKYLSRQEKVRVGLFIAGSVLLLGSKIWEYIIT